MNLFRGSFGTLPQYPIYLRLSLLLALGWISVGGANAADESPPPSHEAALHSPPNTEAEWIVQSVTGEIARLAAYAAKLDGGALPPDAVKVGTLPRDAAGYHYAIELQFPKQDPLRKSIDIPGAIWDPEAYAPLAHELFARMGLDKQKQLGSIGGNPLTTLTTPHAQIIQEENRRISQWLTQHPLDAAAHEQAALLLGTLGMRENCGSFM